MKTMTISFFAGAVLTALSSTAFAQTAHATPATRACMAGEQEVGGRCVPLTRAPDINSTRPGNNQSTGGGPDNATGTTGSVGGGATTGTNAGGAGAAGGTGTGGNNAGTRQ